MIGETRVLANSGYGTPICQTLNQAEFWNVRIQGFADEWPKIGRARLCLRKFGLDSICILPEIVS
jgi:hypothetical protein